ncbi:ZIP family metal transporter [Solibacillus sp. MA9]|uniref:ZIP family metal transporter n=1 Tax=Solibacillus palustris TaxID=2908203 RepID=A0ABS9UEB4_9BACL|nr:ZIP family metal transporter [Solibacillus sp. MA9]MCH7322677.1 ZIP family metal transporter [Solibacillus sp. MA9]
MWLLGFLCTSSGIFIGGMIAWHFKGLQQRVDIIYGLCAGIILGLISFEIFPEAIELGGWLSTIIGFTIGMIIFEVLHNSLHNNQGKNSTSKKKLYIRTGLTLMFSFSVHNLPIGLILATNQESDFTMTLLQTLLFHSIPEGIILFTPLILAGINIFIVLLISIIVSIPVSLGFFIGGYLGFDLQLINTILISVTIGIIFMVTISEILYPVLIKSSTFKVLFWVLIGLGIIVFYLKLL